MAGITNLSKTMISSFLAENAILLILLSVVSYFLYKLVKGSQWTKNVPPGPIGIPFFGYIPFLGKEPHKTVVDLSKKYGSNIISLQMGANSAVILNDYKTVKDTICHQAALDRSPNIFDHIPELGFIEVNGEEWQEQRRFCMQSMRDLGIGKGPWETIITEEVAGFLEVLKSKKGKPYDPSHRLVSAIANNILSLLIGRKIEREKEEDKINLIVDYADVSFIYTGPSLITTLIPSLRKVFEVLKIAGYGRFRDTVTNFCKLVKEEVKRHKLQLEYKGVMDFINLYLEEKESVSRQEIKHYFSETSLEGHVKILFLGATDTISSSLGWLFRLMVEHQDIQKRVQDELDDKIGRENRLYYDDRFKVPFTYAVVMEAQRFSSIVPLSTTRRANTDFEVQGYTIPKGTEIIANLWALHNDPAYWKEPEKFIPERFLKDNNSKLIISRQAMSFTIPSYAPFSIGRRNCPGETVALMEILVFFTSVLQKFNITVPPGEKAIFDIQNGLVAHLLPQDLCFTERPEAD